MYTLHVRGTLQSSSFADFRLRLTRILLHPVPLFVHCMRVAYYGNPASAFHTLLVAGTYRNSVFAVFILRCSVPGISCFC